MNQRNPKILLVEPDPVLLEVLVDSLSTRLEANVTCVSDGESCLDVEMLDPHDLLIAEVDLPDVTGLTLASRMTALSRRPVILLADHTTCDDVVAAMRLGVRDFFRKPFRVGELLDAAQRALCGLELTRERATKYRNLRRVVRQMIRERRDINRRMELVCRDLVEAQRRLARRILVTGTARS